MKITHFHGLHPSSSPSLLLRLLLPLLLQAEELIRKIEKEEEQISYDDPDKKVFHLCIVNLVIG